MALATVPRRFHERSGDWDEFGVCRCVMRWLAGCGRRVFGDGEELQMASMVTRYRIFKDALTSNPPHGCG